MRTLAALDYAVIAIYLVIVFLVGNALLGSAKAATIMITIGLLTLMYLVRKIQHSEML